MSKLKLFVKPVLSTTALLMCSVLLGACTMQRNLDEMHDATMDMRGQTTEMNGRMKGMSDTTTGMAGTTGGMAKTMDHMSGTTDGMATTTGTMAKKMEHLSNTTDGMATTTGGLSTKMGHMSDTTDGMASKMAHMSDTTDGMATTTQGMSGKMEDVRAISNRLEAETAELYDALKQSDSNLSRQNTLKLVIQDKSVQHKLADAVKYFWAFEFQVWSGIGQDTPEKRMDLAFIGAREFLNDISECMEPGQVDPDPLALNEVLDKNLLTTGARFAQQGLVGGIAKFLANIVDPTAPALGQELAEKGNRQLCLNAMAAQLQETNYKQTTVLKQRPELAKLTMLSLIEASLRAKVEMSEKGKELSDYPEFVTQVLMREENATLLLQARYNFLGTMVLGLTTNIQDGVLAPAKMMLADWKMDLSKKNKAQVAEVTGYLKDALRMRKFMLEVGIQPKLDAGLVKILNHGVLSKVALNQTDFNKFLEDYRTGNETTARKAKAIQPMLEIVAKHEAPTASVDATPVGVPAAPAVVALKIPTSSLKIAPAPNAASVPSAASIPMAAANPQADAIQSAPQTAEPVPSSILAQNQVDGSAPKQVEAAPVAATSDHAAKPGWVSWFLSKLPSASPRRHSSTSPTPSPTPSAETIATPNPQVSAPVSY